MTNSVACQQAGPCSENQTAINAVAPGLLCTALMRRSSKTNVLEHPRRIAEVEGVAVLTEPQLLALLLGSGGDDHSAFAFARKVLAQVNDSHGFAHGLGRLGPVGLRRLGLGRKQAVLLAAALELGRRAERQAYRELPREPLTAPMVAKWALGRLGALEHEEVWVLCVDAKSTLLSTQRVGRGGAHGCALLPKDLLTPVVREGASGFILVHNHPSGDPSPSPEDLELTAQVCQAAEMLATPLLDHVIVGRKDYRSLLEMGYLRRVQLR